jgi:hypothetical protein
MFQALIKNKQKTIPCNYVIKKKKKNLRLLVAAMFSANENKNINRSKIQKSNCVLCLKGY